MRQPLALGLFLCLALVQLAVPASMLVRHELTLQYGRQYRFQTAPTTQPSQNTAGVYHGAGQRGIGSVGRAVHCREACAGVCAAKNWAEIMSPTARPSGTSTASTLFVSLLLL